MLISQITSLAGTVADVLNGFTEWLTGMGKARATIRRFSQEQRDAPRKGRRCNGSMFELCVHLPLSDSDRTVYFAVPAGDNPIGAFSYHRFQGALPS